MIRPLAILLPLAYLLLAPPTARSDAANVFAPFLDDEATAARLQPVIDRLESEDFREREAASRELASLPALPAFLRELAQTEARPESAQRLRALAEGFPVTEENRRLTAILRDIATESVKGRLGVMCRVVEREIWTPEDEPLFAAATATATAADLPLIREHIRSSKPMLRRLSAAALDGLDPGETREDLAGLLDDTDPGTVRLAARALARRNDTASLPAFARLLDSPDFFVRHQCHAALLALTGEDFGFDPGDTPEGRQRAAARWREWVASGQGAISGVLPRQLAAVPLFNGRNLAGWEARVGNVLIDRQNAWQTEGDSLVCTGERIHKPGDLWTTQGFENFILTLEYLARDESADSGVGVLLTAEHEREPGYLEVQTLPGNGGDLYNIGRIKIRTAAGPLGFSAPRQADPKDKAGQWHRLKLTVRDGSVTVEINGLLVNRATDGPRGPGRIVLRNEGSGVAFRNILLEPL